MGRLAGVFAPRERTAPTPERLVEALGPSASSAAVGAMTAAWTADAVAQTGSLLDVAVGSPAPEETTEIEARRGRFAIVRWDPTRGDGFLAVDPLGAASLFLHDDGARLTFASEVVDLLRLLPRRPAPNRRALVRWLADGSLELGDTFFDGIRRLAGGQTVRLTDRGWRTERYWKPRYGGVQHADLNDHEARLREAVTAAVDRAASGASRAGVLLSGGLDSTTVAAIAGRRVPLTSYSTFFPDYPEADESRTIEGVVERLGLRGRQASFGHASVMQGSEEYLRTWGLPPASPMLAVHRPVLDLAREDRIDALLDGQGGDELFGESPYLVTDRVRSGHMPSALQLARLALPNRPSWRALAQLGVKGNLPSATHRALRLLRPRRYAPQWLRPEAARLFAQPEAEWSWKRLDGPRWWAFLADRVTAGRERSGVHDYLRHKSALAGAEGRHPLMQDVDLIRVVLSLPPELAFDSSLDRPLLRRSMAGIVPDEVRLSSEKPHFTRIFVGAMAGSDFDRAAALLRPGAEVYAFVQQEAVERLLRASQERRAARWAWALWRLAVCERWLQLQTADP